MADALDKVTNMMLPNLEGNQMANLLGDDTVRKARGRGLLDAGLTAMALAGPRPANENVNTAMILKQMVDQGTNTYDKSIDRATNQLQTTTALQDEVQKKETFYKLLQSDYVNDEQRAFSGGGRVVNNTVMTGFGFTASSGDINQFNGRLYGVVNS